MKNKKNPPFAIGRRGIFSAIRGRKKQMLFLEHFQFEMLRISNHTACYSRGTAATGKTTVFLLPFILPEKARWGRDRGFGGKGKTSRASSDRMAAAGRARCDEGSYGHRQQR